MNDNMDFEEYIRQGEPDKKEKASIWQTAIGLQAVDGLKTSDYLMQTARKHIEGDIDIEAIIFRKLCVSILIQPMSGKSNLIWIPLQVTNRHPTSTPQAPHKYRTSCILTIPIS